MNLAVPAGRQIRSINAHAGGVTAIDFTHDGRLVSCGRDKLVRIWDASGKQIRVLEPLGDLALEVAFSHDGCCVIAGDWAGETRLSNTADGRQVARLPANPPSSGQPPGGG